MDLVLKNNVLIHRLQVHGVVGQQIVEWLLEQEQLIVKGTKIQIREFQIHIVIYLLNLQHLIVLIGEVQLVDGLHGVVIDLVLKVVVVELRQELEVVMFQDIVQEVHREVEVVGLFGNN